ncbi:MAG: hypothetical protein ACRCS9_15790 [Hyphomicrobium sp.]
MKAFLVFATLAGALLAGAVSANAAGEELRDLDRQGQIVTSDGFAGPR